MDTVNPACASDAASLALEVRADAQSVKDLYAAVPAHRCMSRSVERDGQMSSPPVLPRGLCGLETTKTTWKKKKTDGRHRVLKEMIVMYSRKEEAELALLPVDGCGPPRGVQQPMENPVHA